MNEENNFWFLDNSRLTEWKRCPRMYFFHYHNHLVQDKLQPALDFGTCWHAAMDAVYDGFFNKGLRGAELAKLGMQAFNASWVTLGWPLEISIADEAEYKGRTPGTALEMLHNYVSKRTPWLETLELVAIEKSFAVPIDPDDPSRVYVGRLDKVIKENGRYWGIEHKTSSLFSKADGIQKSWSNDFEIDSQVDGYSFAMRTMFKEKSMGIYVDGALVRKQHHDVFKLLPISKIAGDANNWLEDVVYWWDQLENGLKKKVFPRNAPSSCRTVYGECHYRNACLYTPDVEAFKETPGGYKVAKWEPFSFDELREAMQGGEAA